MSNELTLNASLAYSDSEDSDVSLEIADLILSVVTKKFTRFKQNVGTSEEALVLGEVSSLGYIMIVNRDETNYVEIRVSTGSTKFIKLKAGEFAIFRFGSGVTAPYIIADTAACQVDVLLIST